MLCKGQTASGNPCGRHARGNGYCASHDPAIRAERDRIEAEDAKQQACFNDVLNSIYATCADKGWMPNLTDQDKRNWRYATVSVRKNIAADYVTHTVSALLHVTVDGGVKVQLTRTSGHSYGLDDLHSSIINDLRRLPWLESSKKQATPAGINRVLKIAERFHVVATQMRRRYSGRETLRIEDEYDVQDLLHALLKIDFDDVRPEEYSPSKAGASSRLDFLLKSPKIVVEAKMASASLTDKKIGEQLIIDIERYKAHPDCERLVCLVYDPGNHIRNPTGLERDLSRKEESIEVTVVIVPK
jgi:hypothetical protein